MSTAGHIRAYHVRRVGIATFLQILRVLEIALGALLTLAVLLASNQNWGILYLLVIFAWIHALPVLIGFWALIFRPALRRVAAWIVLLPIAFLVIPIAVRRAIGNPLDPRLLFGIGLIATAALLFLSFVRPRRVARCVPAELFRSKAWNMFVLSLLVLGWLVAIAAMIKTGPALLDTSSGQGSPGRGGAVMLVMTVAWLGGLALLSLVVAAFGWLGLRGSIDGAQRRLHVAQLLLSAPALLFGVLVLLHLQTG